MHLCLSLFVVVSVASSGQELRAVWADEVDALGQRRHDAVGFGVGTGDAVSVNIYSSNRTNCRRVK